MIQIGDKMPAFCAADQFGKDWCDEELRGHKTVIYAYPKDNTPGCTAEACDIRDNYERFLAAGYKVFGVSRDSKESHIKFAAKFELPFRCFPTPTISSWKPLVPGVKRNSTARSPSVSSAPRSSSTKTASARRLSRRWTPKTHLLRY